MVNQCAAAPFMYQNGTMKDAQSCRESVYNALKHGTLAMGYLGIAETMTALFGRIMQKMPKFINLL